MCLWVAALSRCGCLACTFLAVEGVLVAHIGKGDFSTVPDSKYNACVKLALLACDTIQGADRAVHDLLFAPLARMLCCPAAVSIHLHACCAVLSSVHPGASSAVAVPVVYRSTLLHGEPFRTFTPCAFTVALSQRLEFGCGLITGLSSALYYFQFSMGCCCPNRLLTALYQALVMRVAAGFLGLLGQAAVTLRPVQCHMGFIQSCMSTGRLLKLVQLSCLLVSVALFCCLVVVGVE